MTKYLTWLIKIGVTAGMLFLIFQVIPFENVIQSLKTADPILIALALGLAVLQMYLSAGRLKKLTDWQGLSVPFKEIVKINFISGFYGTVLPGGMAGGAVRWYRLYTIDRKGAEALAAILFARIVSIAFLVLLGILFVSLDSVHPYYRVTVLILSSILAAITAISLLGFHRRAVAITLWLDQGQHRFLPGWLRAQLGKLIIATTRFHELPLKSVFTVAGLSLLEHMSGILLMFLLARSLDVAITFIQIGWIRSVVLVITLMPVSISGLGVREGTLLMLLKPYSVDGADALALSLLIFGRGLFDAAIGGLLEFWEWLFGSSATKGRVR